MDTSAAGKKKYDQLVKEVSPNSALLMNCIKAFITGGLICVGGQWLNTFFTNMGASKDDAGMYVSVTIIFIAVVLTGIGVFDKIGKFCGAGTVVPITGFANSVAAPAIEFKKEGMILGIGAKMFLVAGPVIVYGLLSSVLVGIIYYFVK